MNKEAICKLLNVFFFCLIIIMSIRIKLKKQPPIIKKSLNILLIKNDKPNESQYSLLKVDRIRHVAEVASRK